MGTMLRNANIVASRTLLVLPFVSTVVYLAPQISLVLFVLLLVLAFPLYAVNKASSLSFQNMQSSNLLDRKAGRKLDYPVYTSQNTLNFYKNMLHAPLHARLIVDIITAFTVCVGLLYVLTHEVSLSTSVMFLIGFRFLFSNISAIASSMAALNRFYGTLHELAQKYFDDDEFMKISSRNYNLNKFYQNLEGAKNQNKHILVRKKMRAPEQFVNCSKIFQYCYSKESNATFYLKKAHGHMISALVLLNGRIDKSLKGRRWNLTDTF